MDYYLVTRHGNLMFVSKPFHIGKNNKKYGIAETNGISKKRLRFKPWFESVD